ALTKKVVDKAQNYQANVEAELGYIAKLGQSKEKVGFTDPDEAKIFVDETGISALAVAIGTSHGFYTKEPNLDIERLKSIHKLIPDIALVLHGGSGVPNEQLKKAISEGIVKINFATEIKNMFMGELKRALNKTEEIDLRIVFPEAIASVEKLVGDKLKVVTV
ncbi:MAG TPA: class II fructose-bisphosphate aldolase, partial [Balneolales bacterium]|nr:class II fructose-bisphosphate aldolase [Balneolales bacterium]